MEIKKIEWPSTKKVSESFGVVLTAIIALLIFFIIVDYVIANFIGMLY